MLAVAALVSVLAMAAGLLSAVWRDAQGAAVPRPVEVTVAETATTPPLPPAWLGLSLEYSAIPSYAGSDPTTSDPVFVQLVRNLTPGQSPVLRIGGDTADWTWWPVPGMRRPLGVTYSLTPAWVAATRSLSQTLGARLILGLNLEADSPAVAGAEARALLAGLGAARVLAFELGNEPALYPTFPWYRTADGRGVPGRPRGYGFDSFVNDFGYVAGGLPAHPLAGPSTGGPGWHPFLGRFLSSQPQVRLVTLHRYPLQLCVTPRRSRRFPTVPNLLSAAASEQWAADFAGPVAVAHEHGLPLRIDELNTVSCGADPPVSQSFAAALWVVDALFELEHVGVDGVQVHTFPGAGYELFHLRRRGGRWTATVAPEYYGLVLFATVSPPGSRLLSVRGSSGGSLKVWVVQQPDRHALRVVLINKDTASERAVALRLPGTAGTATLERLLAPSADSRGPVTLGGQSFPADGSTGSLSGSRHREEVTAQRGRYVVGLPPASAAVLAVRLR